MYKLMINIFVSTFARTSIFLGTLVEVVIGSERPNNQ